MTHAELYWLEQDYWKDVRLNRNSFGEVSLGGCLGGFIKTYHLFGRFQCVVWELAVPGTPWVCTKWFLCNLTSLTFICTCLMPIFHLGNWYKVFVRETVSCWPERISNDTLFAWLKYLLPDNPCLYRAVLKPQWFWPGSNWMTHLKISLFYKWEWITSTIKSSDIDSVWDVAMLIV